MAYTLFRRGPRCYVCRRRDIPLYTLHGSTGALIGTRCTAHAHEWIQVEGVTSSPLGNVANWPPARARKVTPRRG